MMISMTPPLIHALLPHKETFTQANAGAVAMVAQDMVASSRWAKHVHIFGRPLEDELLLPCYTGIEPRYAWLFGKNIGLGQSYLHYLKTTGITPDWVEVHGRCQVAALLAKARPDLKIVLVLHNDPRQMKGGKTVAQRARLARELTGVFSVSHYLMTCFNQGLDAKTIQHVIPHGVDVIAPKSLAKKNRIAIVGRMVKEKGMLEIAQALAKTLPQHPDWSVDFIGGRRFEQSKITPYEEAVVKALAPLGGQARFLGFLPLDKVRQHQCDAAIAVVPSIWQEPAGRVVLEAMAAGCALITTRRGGIPEYAEGRALLVDEPTPEHFAQALHRLITDSEERKRLQSMAFHDYPFTLKAAGEHLDQARQAVMDA